MISAPASAPVIASSASERRQKLVRRYQMFQRLDGAGAQRATIQSSGSRSSKTNTEGDENRIITSDTRTQKQIGGDPQALERIKEYLHTWLADRVAG
jgi:hypothetical protein